MALPEVKLTDPRSLRGYAHPLRMALVGLLRREGPLTATQTAERLNESVPSCSFHLRQLAKYGLAERAEGADGRERPWRATALTTSWENVSDDPATQAAADQLNAVILDNYVKRAQAFLAQRGNEPPEWREVTGFGDSLVYLTAPELAELVRKIDALVAEFDERVTDPSTRPEGARGIGIIQMALTTPPTPTRPEPTTKTRKGAQARKASHTKRRPAR
jgi:DNA-binding MarR family transcriptional regulator